MIKTLKKLFTKKFLQGVENPVFTKIKEKKILNHDTYILKCELPKNHILGVPIGQHIRIYNKCKKKSKSFTPISLCEKKNEFDLLIKTYFPNKNFPEGGNLSLFLNSLKENDYLKICGPKGRLFYKKDGFFLFKKKNFSDLEKKNFEEKLKKNEFKKFRRISMISGGTGITPLYQIALHLQKEKIPDLKMRLIFANKTENDIFLKNEIEKLQNENFEVKFLVEKKIDENYDGEIGRVNGDIIEDFFWKKNEEQLFLICGSKNMVAFLEDLLISKGFDKENIFGY